VIVLIYDNNYLWNFSIVFCEAQHFVNSVLIFGVFLFQKQISSFEIVVKQTVPI
jgi:hypothetical protein